MVLVSPPLKSLLKGPPLSFQGVPPICRQGYSKKQAPPQSRVYRRVHTDWSDLLYYNIQISGGRCLNPQKKEVARVHRRRKLLESTEEGSCSSPQKKEFARNYRRRKLLKTTEEESCNGPYKEVTARIYRREGISSPQRKRLLESTVIDFSDLI